jgi:hypothetical protein
VNIGILRCKFTSLLFGSIVFGTVVLSFFSNELSGLISFRKELGTSQCVVPLHY